jgi:hypothetical protein
MYPTILYQLIFRPVPGEKFSEYQKGPCSQPIQSTWYQHKKTVTTVSRNANEQSSNSRYFRRTPIILSDVCRIKYVSFSSADPIRNGGIAASHSLA